MLVDLPDALGKKILQSWLLLADIPKLDSAFSHHEHRQQFKTLAYGKSTLYHGHDFELYRSYHSSMQCSYYHRLLMERGISVSLFSLAPIPSRFGPTLQEYEQYLEKFGSVMSAVTVSSNGIIARMDTEMQLVATYCTNVHSLELADCPCKDAELGRVLITNCTKLERLVLHQSQREELYEELALHCTNLRHLTLHHSDTEPEHLYSILKRCPDLQHLELDYCHNILDHREASLQNIAKYCRKLSTFVVSYMHFDGPGLASVFNSCPLLTTVRFAHAHFTDATVFAAVTRCPLLQEVAFTDCYDVTDEIMVTLAQHCEGLSVFKASECAATDTGLTAMAEGCPLLTVLAIDSRYTSLTDASVLSFAAHCPLLVDVSLGKCSELTDFAVIALAHKRPQLRQLTLTGCTNVNNAGLAALGKNCSSLTTLKIIGSEFVSAKGFKALHRGCNNLVSVTIDKPTHKRITKATRKLYGKKLVTINSFGYETDISSDEE